MLVVIEGIDGCGKNAVADLVAKSIGALRLDFPNYSTDTGKLIKAMLRGEAVMTGDDKLNDPMVMQALQIVNRHEQLDVLASAAGSPDVHLVLARYMLSGFVYGSYDGLSANWLAYTQSGLPRADLTLWLDVPTSVAMARCAARDKAPPERYEKSLEMQGNLRLRFFNAFFSVDPVIERLLGKVRQRIDASESLPLVAAQAVSSTHACLPRAPLCQLGNGEVIDFLKPDVTKIPREYVADVLSRTFRFGAATKYSVAQHVCACAYAAGPVFAKEALHHDDVEAVVGDAVSPLKRAMYIIGDDRSPYHTISTLWDSAIRESLGLPLTMSSVVREIDLSMCQAERLALLPRTEAGDASWSSLAHIKPYCGSLIPWSPEKAKESYLYACELFD